MFVRKVLSLKNYAVVLARKNYCNYVHTHRFDGKVAVISGGTAGIGLSVAKILANEGATVIISSRKQANVDEAVDKLAAEGIKVIGIACHAAKKEERKAILEKAARFGGIDTLILNAGVNPVPGPVINTDEQLWDKAFDTNVKAQFFFTKEALPLMKKRHEGSIIFMSTGATYFYVEGLGLYSTSKSALHCLTRVLANELAPYNITVNCVAPGSIKTKFGSILQKDDKILQNVPLKRIGDPEDVSGVIAFLTSKDARYITGEIIVISGGLAPSRL